MRAEKELSYIETGKIIERNYEIVAVKTEARGEKQKLITISARKRIFHFFGIHWHAHKLHSEGKSERIKMVLDTAKR